MEGRDFIFTGLQPWDIPIGSNAIDIAREVSKNNRVLYVNSPLDHIIAIRKSTSPDILQRQDVLRKRKDALRKISVSLWALDLPFSVLPVNFLPDGFIFDFFNKLNNRKIFRYIKKKADELGFTNVIHFIDNDIYRSYYSKELLKPALSVYYRRDNMLSMFYWKKHAQRLEPQLIAKSEIVVANSPQLADYAREFNPASYYVGQGVDLSAYDTAISFSVPEELASIPCPRIGYIGDINSMRLDPELIYELASSKPQYSFVMIGREDNLFASHDLHKLKNVFFTGSIPKKEVPRYMSALDVCLNPQKINEITIGNYPRKVDEYLAMGKPVIATRTATMEIFSAHTCLCSSVEEYCEAVEKALRENSREKEKARISFAQSHSWKNNVENIYRCIKEA